MGTRTLAAEVLGSTPWLEPSQSLPLAPPKSWVGSSAGSPQSKQPTGREPSPTHQQRSGLKFYCALPIRAQHPALPTRAQHPALPTTSPSHQEACISLLDRLIHQRADSRSKKNYNSAACGMKTTFTEK